MKHVTSQMVRQHFVDPSLPFHEWAIPIGVHLLRRCEICQKAVHEAFALWTGLDPDDPRVERDAFEYLYRQGVPGELLARQARIDADELLALSPTQRRHRLAGESLRFRSPALVDELLARCEDFLTVDPDESLELSELAVEISLRTDPEIVGSLAFQARARAAAHYGNCLRLDDQAQKAEEMFGRAGDFCAQAPWIEPELEAELHRLEASLAIDQRRFELAEEHLDRAIDLYRQLDDSHALGLTLLKRAHAAYQSGTPGDGIDDLREAASKLDSAEHRRPHLMIRFNLTLYAIEAEEVELARSYYHEHRQLLESQSEPWFALRLLWLRAKLARAEGDAPKAGELYSRAREGFLGEGMGYDAALVSLELALVHLETGDLPAVQHLAAEMLPVFQAQDVHREALAALALFQQAALAQELTTELTHRLRRYLQLAQKDPSLTFDEFQADFRGEAC